MERQVSIGERQVSIVYKSGVQIVRSRVDRSSFIQRKCPGLSRWMCALRTSLVVTMTLFRWRGGFRWTSGWPRPWHCSVVRSLETNSVFNMWHNDLHNTFSSHISKDAMCYKLLYGSAHYVLIYDRTTNNIRHVHKTSGIWGQHIRYAVRTIACSKTGTWTKLINLRLLAI